MDNMKEQILQLIDAKPRHFAKMVKNSPELYQWVIENTQVATNNMSEMIYSAMYNVDNKCNSNNIKKFKSITDGYGFCGTAGMCACAAQSVSKKVIESKSKRTQEQRDLTNQRRQTTSMTKYGVANNAQTATARKNHKQHYLTIDRKPSAPLLTPYQRLNKKYKTSANIEFVTLESEYKGVSNQAYYKFNCLTCNSMFDDYVDNGHTPICKICNPYTPTYTSKQETEVYEYIKSITDLSIYQSNKSIINPWELDIVIPELKLAIEYCGLYWHSEAQKSNKNYHIDKMARCAEQGYRLVTIFEDEWTEHPAIVKSRLKSIIGCDQVIHARKCQVSMISSAQAREFVTRTHIQGWAVAKLSYGCFYNNQLVAVMTFGKPRYDKTAEYELIRYCSQGTVVGAAGRLLSAFCREHTPGSIISYCDMRWGTGNLYKKLNFVQESGGTTPGYSYTDFIKRYHRSSFTKQRIAKTIEDKSKTEHSIMREKQMYRIWDCGQTKWRYTLGVK